MSEASSSADRYRVVKALDGHRDDLTQAALALAKAYRAFLEGAANAPVPPKVTPQVVSEALANYRKAVAKARKDVTELDRRAPDRADALEALSFLDAGLKGMQGGTTKDYAKASKAAERGRKKMRRYPKLAKKLHVPRSFANTIRRPPRQT